MGDSGAANDMMTLMEDLHDDTIFSTPVDVKTSQGLSNYLLNTTIEGNRNLHFGAFVLNDEVNMKLNVDWSEYVPNLDTGSNITLSFDDILNSFGLGDTLLSIDAIFNTTLFSDITSLIDNIVNLTGTESLVITSDMIAELIDNDVAKILKGEEVSYEFDITDEVSILHNTSSPHAVAAFAQSYYNYQFMQCYNNTSTRLTALNHPLPLTSRQSSEVRFYLSVFVSLFLLIPFCYIPPTFAIFAVKERSNKSKHLQLVSGVDTLAYWVSTLIWDLMGYTIITLLVILIFLAYGENQAAVFVGTIETFFCSCILIWGYGISSIPSGYLLSR